MKSFTDALIRRLNKACKETKCARECAGIGWCNKCWEIAKNGK